MSTETHAETVISSNDALDTVATSTTQGIKKKTQVVLKDGIIYFTISNVNSLLKTGYFYCNYILDSNEQNDNIDTMQRKLSNVYSANGELIDLCFFASSKTKEIFERFVSDYCVDFSDNETEDDKERIKHHDNIFKTTATILKKHLSDAAIKCGFDITFKTTKSSNSVKVYDESKPKQTRTRKTKKEPKDVKDDVKDEKKTSRQIKGARKALSEKQDFEEPVDINDNESTDESQNESSKAKDSKINDMIETQIVNTEPKEQSRRHIIRKKLNNIDINTDE